MVDENTKCKNPHDRYFPLYIFCAILVYMARNIRLYPEPVKTAPGTATPKIPRGLLALAKEARKYKSAEEFTGTLGIPAENIVWMKAFGSSVEGKLKPGDIDIFVAAKNGRMRFTRDDELYNPIVKESGMT